MTDPAVQGLMAALTRGEISRREFIRRLTALGLSMPVIAALLQACGGDDDDDDGGSSDGGGDDEPTATEAAEATESDGGADEDEAEEDEPTEAAPEEDEGDESDDDGGASAPSGELVVAQGPEITSLDGSMSTGMLTFNVVVHMMEPLLFRGDDMKPYPHLAESMEQVDATTFNFTIREGVTFHNGDPLTVDDVVFTIQRISDPNTESELLRYARTVTSVEALDERTVQIKLSEPDVTFPLRLTLVPIVPKAVVEELGDEGFDANPMGTGPYRFVEWRRGDRVIMEAYEDYWQGPPKIETLVFRGIPEDSTRIAEVQTGGAGLVTNVPTQLVPEIESNPDTQLYQVNSLRTIFCVLNTLKAPFDDVRVRQAANYAVDKDLIVEGILDGYATPTSQPFGPEVFGYNPDLENYYAYDPDRARELLAEAGYDENNRPEVNIFSAVGRILKDEEVVQNIAAQLEEVGFAVNLNFSEYQAYFDTYFGTGEPGMDLDIGFFSNANNTADADYNLSLNVHSGGRGIYWQNTEVDELIDKARQTEDQDERLALYHQLLEIMIPEAPWLFLYTQHDLYGATSKLKGWNARPDEMIYLYPASLED
ncbi:MAG TPA: ABC transporter substrate-binding protein [Thermomicrobiales bacterium]|nr:ABC transporter substrate-binding protein [Thermomicrobiales bacterium]